MAQTLHITSGDIAGDSLKKSGIGGTFLIWHDVLYDGPRTSGWPDKDILSKRSLFLEQFTGGGLSRKEILSTLEDQYKALENLSANDHIVLWFDACLFDQSMLVHILTCLHELGNEHVELICIDSYPGIEPFNGLGQLEPEQLFSRYKTRIPVTEIQFKFSVGADRAFATNDPELLTELAEKTDAPLPWVPAAAKRWLQEVPDPKTGFGRLETLIIDALRAGCDTPWQIFNHVAKADTPPQYWGDTTLWVTINALADRDPTQLKIEGPSRRIPQWKSEYNLKNFKITAATHRNRNNIDN